MEATDSHEEAQARCTEMARYAKALAHPTRLRILMLLSNQSCCFTGDLTEWLSVAQSTVSQHLQELKNAGLIQGTIHPPRTRYCLNQANWARARETFQDFFALFGPTLDAGLPPEADVTPPSGPDFHPTKTNITTTMKNVKILGTGCPKCKQTTQAVEQIVSDLKLDIQIDKVEDIAQIMAYDVMSTPAVVVDGEVKIKGRVPTADELKALLA